MGLGLLGLWDIGFWVLEFWFFRFWNFWAFEFWVLGLGFWVFNYLSVDFKQTKTTLLMQFCKGFQTC